MSWHELSRRSHTCPCGRGEYETVWLVDQALGSRYERRMLCGKCRDVYVWDSTPVSTDGSERGWVRAGSSDRHCVLVVEDDRELRTFVESALELEGCWVLSAPDGAEALEILDRAQPCLILLDMRMPRMDGWEFARCYRERPGPRAPVVVMTAAPDAAARAAEALADGYLAKPFELDALYATVDRYCRAAPAGRPEQGEAASG